VHTVCELNSFQRDASAIGMTESEVEILIDFLSLNPDAGDEIRGLEVAARFVSGGEVKERAAASE
jgi:hypothetical protein